MAKSRFSRNVTKISYNAKKTSNSFGRQRREQQDSHHKQIKKLAKKTRKAFANRISAIMSQVSREGKNLETILSATTDVKNFELLINQMSKRTKKELVRAGSDLELGLKKIERQAGQNDSICTLNSEAELIASIAQKTDNFIQENIQLPNGKSDPTIILAIILKEIATKLKIILSHAKKNKV